MKKENLFYLIFLITVIATRIGVIIFPERDTYIFNVVIHHFWYGVVLLLIGLVIPKKYELVKTCTFAIGLGLFIDQLVFMILGAGKDKEYWALPSLLGTIIFAVIMFPMRQKLTNYILQKSTKTK